MRKPPTERWPLIDTRSRSAAAGDERLLQLGAPQPEGHVHVRATLGFGVGHEELAGVPIQHVVDQRALRRGPDGRRFQTADLVPQPARYEEQHVDAEDVRGVETRPLLRVAPVAEHRVQVVAASVRAGDPKRRLRSAPRDRRSSGRRRRAGRTRARRPDATGSPTTHRTPGATPRPRADGGTGRPGSSRSTCSGRRPRRGADRARRHQARARSCRPCRPRPPGPRPRAALRPRPCCPRTRSGCSSPAGPDRAAG